MFTYSIPVRLRGLPTAEVAQGPSRVAEHAQLTAVAKEVQERLESTAAENVVTAVGAVAGNVAESPDSLFPHIGLGAGKKFNEDGDSSGLNHDLGLSGRAGGNVGQGPSSLKLHQSVRRS